MKKRKTIYVFCKKTDFGLFVKTHIDSSVRANPTMDHFEDDTNNLRYECAHRIQQIYGLRKGTQVIVYLNTSEVPALDVISLCRIRKYQVILKDD